MWDEDGERNNEQEAVVYPCYGQSLGKDYFLLKFIIECIGRYTKPCSVRLLYIN